MNEFIKYFWRFISYLGGLISIIVSCFGGLISIILCIALTILMFFMIKHIDFIFFSPFHVQANSTTNTDFINSFQGYRDFVTVITGLLTLIIGFTGFATILSYKKLTEKEASFKVIEDEAKKLIDKLGKYSSIQKANAILANEAEKASAIKVLNDEEKHFDVDSIFHKLLGDAYYYRGKNDDYNVAIDEYNEAIESNKKLSGAWFGLGQAKYRSVCEALGDCAEKYLPVTEVEKFILSDKREYRIKDIEVARVAIRHLDTAISYGHDQVVTGFEKGRMYKDIGEYNIALSEFKKAFDANPGYSVCGYYYCHLWVLTKQDELRSGGIDKNDIDELVKKLKFVGFTDLYNGKAAYALLWYLHSIVPTDSSESDARHALHATDQYTINDLFELKTSTNSPC